MVGRESYKIPKRVAVTRAFSRLKEKGAVELEGRRIVVKDRMALESLTEAW